jgi:hypothetical protein
VLGDGASDVDVVFVDLVVHDGCSAHSLQCACRRPLPVDPIIGHNTALLHVRTSFRKLSQAVLRQPDDVVAERYVSAFHGVGMSDENLESRIPATGTASATTVRSRPVWCCRARAAWVHCKAPRA